MKKVLSMIIAATMALTISACGAKSETPAAPTTPSAPAANSEGLLGASSATVRFKVGTTTAPTGHYVKGLQEMQRLLESKSGGTMTLDIYPNSQLGNERDMMENVGMGVQDMVLSSTGPIPNFVKEFAVLDLPYLFETAEDAYKVLDGEVGEALLAKLDSQGIIGFGFWENGFRHVTNNTKEIKVPADLKGMQLRTMENKVHMAGYEALGSIPTPMAWGEIFTALQQGTVDGQENPLAIIESAKVYEVQKYISLTGAFYSPCVLMMNEAKFNSLTADQQKAFTEAADEAKDWQRNYSQEYDKKAVESLKSLGITITEVDTSVWAEAVSGVYNNLDSFGIDAVLVKQIQDSLK